MFNETPVVSSTRWALSRLIGICTAEQERHSAEMQQHAGTWWSTKRPERKGGSDPGGAAAQLQGQPLGESSPACLPQRTFPAFGKLLLSALGTGRAQQVRRCSAS